MTCALGLLQAACISEPVPTNPVAASTPALAQPTSIGVRPNIVVVMADDLDINTLIVALDKGFMPTLQTEVIDKSFRFPNAFVSNPQCCPSRATFLTGQYSHNNGVLMNTAAYGGIWAMDERSTLPVWLQDAGYYTGHVGKYLNGYLWGKKDGHYSPPPPGYDWWRGLVDPTTYNLYHYRINDGGHVRSFGAQFPDGGFDYSRVLEEVYQTDVLAGMAREFVAQSSDGGQPFFLMITPPVPHVEVLPYTVLLDGGIQTDGGLENWEEGWKTTIRSKPAYAGTGDSVFFYPQLNPAYNEADMSDKPVDLERPLLTDEDEAYLKRMYRSQFGALRSLDDLVATVLQELAAQGVEDRTVFIFVSDNGFFHGQHRLHGKTLAYEESIRVPLYMRVPPAFLQSPDGGPLTSDGGYVSARVEALVVNTDMAPTIARFAGLDVNALRARGRGLDGRPVQPLLSAAATGEPPPSWRRRFLVEHFHSGQPLETDFPTLAALRTLVPDGGANTVLIDYYTQNTGYEWGLDNAQYASEFYDLSVDPRQLNSDGGDSRVPYLRWGLRQLRTCATLDDGGATPCAELEDL